MDATITLSDDPQDLRACATLMAGQEPWLTLGRSMQACQKTLQDPLQCLAVARLGEQVLGFVLWTEVGLLNGYIRTLAVADGHHGQGLGSRLLARAEQSIFSQSPNTFLCVSEFNAGARRFYEREGYRQVGRLENFLVAGHHEILMRKTRGSWQEFSP